jgi:hypothetical protein
VSGKNRESGLSNYKFLFTNRTNVLKDLGIVADTRLPGWTTEKIPNSFIEMICIRALTFVEARRRYFIEMTENLRGGKKYIFKE